MNPGLLLLPALAAFNLWLLWTGVRRGEFSGRGGGTPGDASTAPTAHFVVKRRDNPLGFWAIAAIQIGMLVMMAYVFVQIVRTGE